jgi:hypothetical protein
MENRRRRRPARGYFLPLALTLLTFFVVVVGFFILVAVHPITGAGTISSIVLKQSQSEPRRLIHGFSPLAPNRKPSQ